MGGGYGHRPDVPIGVGSKHGKRRPKLVVDGDLAVIKIVIGNGRDDRVATTVNRLSRLERREKGGGGKAGDTGARIEF